jgi:hypothetical protein
MNYEVILLIRLSFIQIKIIFIINMTVHICFFVILINFNTIFLFNIIQTILFYFTLLNFQRFFIFIHSFKIWFKLINFIIKHIFTVVFDPQLWFLISLILIDGLVYFLVKMRIFILFQFRLLHFFLQGHWSYFKEILFPEIIHTLNDICQHTRA